VSDHEFLEVKVRSMQCKEVVSLRTGGVVTDHKKFDLALPQLRCADDESNVVSVSSVM
jgi:hypothetical protein